MRALTAVYGDPVAGPHDVVSAFLQDPLSDSEAMRRAILDRYYGTSKDTLFISCVIFTAKLTLVSQTNQRAPTAG